MKILRRILFVIVLLIAAFFIAALFVDGDYTVERSVVINQPKEVVFDYVVHLKNQDEYAVWNQEDPEMKKNYFGKDGSVGFISSWESANKNVGKGEQEIKRIVPNERVDSELRMFEPFESTDQVYMTTKSDGVNSTQLTWGIKGEMKYPMNMLMLLMNMEEMLGEQLQEGLNNAKENLDRR